MKICALNSIYR